MNDSNHKLAGKKPKLVRDSFTIPKAEYAAIDALKVRALTLGVAVKKSELLRAGLMLLQPLSDARFKAAMASVPTIKTGRPAASLKVETRVAPAAVKKTVVKLALRSAATPAKAVVKKAVAKKVVTRAAPKTAAVKVSPSLAAKPVAQAPASKPAALPPLASAAKATVQPAKKVVAKKAAATKA